MSKKVTQSVSDISINSLPDALKNKQFFSGDLIVKASPFAHVISTKYKAIYCHWCALPSKNSTKLFRCSACQHEYYCGKPCQKKAWQYHKFECPIIKAKSPQVPVDCVRLLAKVIWKLSQKIEQRAPDVDPGWRVWTDLCDHSALLGEDEDRSKKYLTAVYMLIQYYGSNNLKLHGMLSDVKDLMSHFSRLQFNTFTLTHMGEEIGAAVYLSPSVFNHSCSPNAAHVCDGTTLYVRALKNINTVKEAIFINYIDPMQPMESRQLELWRTYYFRCHCEKCSNLKREALLESTICPRCEGDVVKQFDDTLICDACNRTIDDTAYVYSCERATEQANKLCDQALLGNDMDMDMGRLKPFLQSNRLLSDKNASLSLVKCTLYAYMSQYGDTVSAYKLGEEITSLLKLYYPEVYPAHGIHQLKQARLAWNSHQHGTAIKHYQHALKGLLLTHGPEHQLTKLANCDIVECQQEKYFTDIR